MPIADRIVGEQSECMLTYDRAYCVFSRGGNPVVPVEAYLLEDDLVARGQIDLDHDEGNQPAQVVVII